jgi:nucleotide-binding universal stress UspA family protein
MSERIVVGIDGSPESRAALDHALAESRRRQAPLRVVAAYIYPEYNGLGWPYPVLVAPETIADATRTAARQMLDEALGACPTPEPVELVVRAGPAAEVLVEESAGAGLLVVGHRGRGAFASTVLGSVGLRCVLHARCPVTVVRPSIPAVPAARDAQEARDAAPATAGSA